MRAKVVKRQIYAAFENEQKKTHTIRASYKLQAMKLNERTILIRSIVHIRSEATMISSVHLKPFWHGDSVDWITHRWQTNTNGVEWLMCAWHRVLDRHIQFKSITYCLCIRIFYIFVFVCARFFFLALFSILSLVRSLTRSIDRSFVLASSCLVRFWAVALPLVWPISFFSS